MGKLTTAYEKFARVAIPSDASTGQHRDMKAAFYAGAVTVLKNFNNLAGQLHEKATTSAGAIDEVESMHQDIADFLLTTASANPEQPTVAQPEKEPS